MYHSLTTRRITNLLDIDVSTVLKHFNGLEILGVIVRIGGKIGFLQIMELLWQRQGSANGEKESQTIPTQNPIQSCIEPGIITYSLPHTIPGIIARTIGLPEKQSKEELPLIQTRFSVSELATSNDCHPRLPAVCFEDALFRFSSIVCTKVGWRIKFQKIGAYSRILEKRGLPPSF
jgi:hypothetical protein